MREQLAPILLLAVLLGFAALRGDPEGVHAGLGHETGRETPRIVSTDAAIATAINELRAIDGGWRSEHPGHRVQWTSEGVDFEARRGPQWHWRLESIGSDQMPMRDVEIGAVRPIRENALQVTYQRGVVDERYVLHRNSVEQQFLLRETPDLQGADLVIAGAVRSTGSFEKATKGWLWRTREGVVSLGGVFVFDAEGSSIEAAMEVAASRIRIVVDGAALASAIFPVTIDPEIGTNDFRISETGSDGDPNRDALEAAVAYNSTDYEYLVVWRADDSDVGLSDDEFKILGQRIDAISGLEVGGELLISQQGLGMANFDDFNPAVAYNSADNEFLVVWEGGTGALGEREIFGQRLNADPGSFGEVGANDFRISDMGAGNTEFAAFKPTVAYNSTDNEFLAAWEGDAATPGEREIFGQRLDADPTSFGEVGVDDFRISDMGPIDGNVDFGAFNPSAAFNSSDREYLVVWEGDDSNAPLVDGEREVFGQRLFADPGSFGEVGVNDFRISDMGSDGNVEFGAFRPAVAHNRIDNEYLVVWQGDDSNDEFEIYGQRLASGGTAAGANDFRISDMGSDGSIEFGAFLPAVAHNQVQNEYLVVWQGSDEIGALVADELEIFGQQLSGAGAAIGDNDFRMSDMGSVDGAASFDAFRPAVVHNGGSNQFLVVWHGDDDTGLLVDEETEVYGQLLGSVADLAISKIDSADPVFAGSNLTYTVTVSNAGPTDAANVVVTDTLPAGVTFASTTGCLNDPNGVPDCSRGTIPAGSWAQYTIAVVVDPATLGVITNNASVTSFASDPDPTDDSIAESTTVIAAADLSVDKQDSQDPVAAGDPLSYTVTVTNSGPSDARNVRVTDTLPVGVVFVSTSGCLDDPVGMPICNLGTIAASGSAQYTVAVIVDVATPSGTITNSVIVETDALDNDSSNDTDSEDTLVDAEPPIVTLVNSWADTGNGSLDECEEAKVAITQLSVRFSESVQDPAGDGGASDVTNPANYRLVAAGTDGDFATYTCGPALGDDSLVAVDAVIYDDGTLTASLAVNGGAALGDSLHRLLVCGSSSIRDIAGNELDGDGDGMGGDDFRRSYRVDRANLFDNGHFDCNIDPWITVSTDPAEIGYGTDDVQASLVSGSAVITNLTGSTDFALGQCPAVVGSAGYSLTGRLRVEAAPGDQLFIARTCGYYSSPLCAGALLLTDTDFTFLGDTGGEWRPLASQLIAPADTASALCSFDLRALGGENFSAYFDDLSLAYDSSAGMIFADGFELGDTSAWSSNVP